MQNENGNGEGSSGQTAQVQAQGEPDHLRVEAGEGKKVRVEVDGRVMCGKLAIVTIVDDEGPQLVRWEELEAGCLYVDRFASGDVSGVRARPWNASERSYMVARRRITNRNDAQSRA